MLKFVGTAQRGDKSLLYFSQDSNGKDSLKLTESANGFEFSDESAECKVVDGEGREVNKFNWRNLRIARQEDKYFATYQTSSSDLLLGAVSNNLADWETTGSVDSINECGTVIPDYQYRRSYIMYFGEKSVKVAHSSYLYQWKALEKPVLEPSKKGFDAHGIEVGNAYLLDDVILLTYFTKQENGRYAVGAANFSADEPTELLWKSEDAVWEFPPDFEYKSVIPLGSSIIAGELIIYWLIDDTNIFAASCALPGKKEMSRVKDFSTIVKKSRKNPIIAPRPDKPWESRATFNSAAVYEDGKVHFVYRALGDKDLSVLGYAASSDGINIDERSDEPIYFPREAFETPGQNIFKSFADHFASGGGYGGIEDPRITKVDNKFYMTYVAFDGANPPRVALTSIDADDFINKRWDRWEKPKLISAPGMVNKNAVIFPEKIKGKYVVFHRVYPNILVDYVDDLNFDNYLQGHYFIPPRKTHWDSKKIGAGAPPLKTDDGWLFIYQSVGHLEPHKYKIGAMLLDKNDPVKVLHRTSSPIIEPVEPYENEGFKSGVVYPCGAVVVNNNLNVYYGGADTVVCAATSELDRFLYEMKRDREPKLRKVTSSLFN